MTLNSSDITRAALAMPDAQRLALVNQLICGVTDPACLLQLCRLHGHVRTIISELEAEKAFDGQRTAAATY